MPIDKLHTAKILACLWSQKQGGPGPLPIHLTAKAQNPVRCFETLKRQNHVNNIINGFRKGTLGSKRSFPLGLKIMLFFY